MNNNNNKPVFIQLIEMIEDSIISKSHKAGDLVISSTQICRLYKVNPATAMRALSSLAADGILEKDRGIGMRVTASALDTIKKRRAAHLTDKMLDDLVIEAFKLGITNEELKKAIDIKFNGREIND